MKFNKSPFCHIIFMENDEFTVAMKLIVTAKDSV